MSELPDIMDASYCLSALIAGKATAAEQQAAAGHMRALMDECEELRSTAEAFYGLTAADATVTIRAASPEKRDAIFAAKMALRAVLASAPEPKAAIDQEEKK